MIFTKSAIIVPWIEIKCSYKTMGNSLKACIVDWRGILRYVFVDVLVSALMYELWVWALFHIQRG